MKTQLQLNILAVISFCCLSAIINTMPVSADSPVSSNGPYALVEKYTVGAVENYALSVDIMEQVAASGRTQLVNMHFDMTDTATIESVRVSDGAASIHIVFKTVDGILNGQPMSADIMNRTKIWPFTALQLPNGRVLTLTPDPGQPANAAFADSSAFMNSGILPTTAVKLGDTWSGTLPAGATGFLLNLQSTLKSVSTTGGSTIARIDTVTSLAPPTNTAQSAAPASSALKFTAINGNLHTDFDIGAGVPERVSGASTTVASITVPGANGAQTAVQVTSVSKMLMTLLPSISK